MEKNKAPRPDGFPAEFYQKNWEFLKGDLIVLFKDFRDTKLPFVSVKLRNNYPSP
jgi:hypothetical protein